LVVWEQPEYDPGRLDYSVYGWFIDRSGNPVGDPFRIVTTPDIDKNPAVAFNGDHYLVTWVDPLNSTINATVVTVTGSVLGDVVISPLVPIPSGLVFDSLIRPAIASNGRDFLIVWNEGSGSTGDDRTDLTGCMVTIDPDGSVVLTVCDIPLGSPEGDYAPSVAFAKENFLVTWSSGSYRSDAWELDILGRLVSSDGQTISDEIAITTEPRSQVDPTVSSDGTNFLVVWRDNQPGPDLLAARVSESGVVLDGPPSGAMIISESGTSPQVAHNGQNWLIVWRENVSPFAFIFGTQVASDGSVLEPSGVPISVWSEDIPLFPAVASDGENFLVTWSGSDLPTLRMQLVGAIPPRIKPLRDRVVNLLEAGSLGKHGKQLTGALDRAESHLAKGHLKPALQQLEQFIRTVEQLADKGEIDLYDANELAAYARLIIYHRTRPEAVAEPVI